MAVLGSAELLMELMSMMSAERKRKGNTEEASVRVPQEKLDCDPKTVMS